MKFTVLPGHAVQIGGATYGPGETFDASGDDAKAWKDDGRVERTDEPTGGSSK